jgi:exodeoxyribonuclease VIII
LNAPPLTAPGRSIPAPGLYEHVSFEEYLTWDCISNSRLHAAEKSLLHYKEQQPIEETASMRLGTFCHVGRLEPSAVYRRYVVMPDLTAGLLNDEGKPYDSPKATKAYKKRVAEFQERNADKLIIPQAEFDEMVGIVAALDRDERAHQWFTAQGPVELSIVWDDPETGLRCKGRLDKLANGLQLIVDLKTSRDCQRFPAQIAERHYHRQGAMYVDGLEVLTGEINQFGLVAVENNPPYGVMAAPLSKADLEQGRDEYRRYLRQIAKARESGIWPAYSSPPQWSLPAWAKRDPEALTLTIQGKQVTL